MKKYAKSLLMVCICLGMIFQTFSVSASSGRLTGTVRGTYMSSATVYATVDGENDIIGNAVVTCLSKVREIDVDMYLQRGYGTTWQNVSEPYNMNVKDTAELDKSAIIRNVTPGIYRVYIVVAVTGYDGLFDTAAVGTATLTINT